MSAEGLYHSFLKVVQNETKCLFCEGPRSLITLNLWSLSSSLFSMNQKCEVLFPRIMLPWIVLDLIKLSYCTVPIENYWQYYHVIILHTVTLNGKQNVNKIRDFKYSVIRLANNFVSFQCLWIFIIVSFNHLIYRLYLFSSFNLPLNVAAFKTAIIFIPLVPSIIWSFSVNQIPKNESYIPDNSVWKKRSPELKKI